MNTQAISSQVTFEICTFEITATSSWWQGIEALFQYKENFSKYLSFYLQNKDTTVVRKSYLYNGNSYSWKGAFQNENWLQGVDYKVSFAGFMGGIYCLICIAE